MKNPNVLILAVVSLAACSSHPVATSASNLTYNGDIGTAYPRPSAIDSAGRNSMAAGDVEAAQESFQKEVDTNPFDPIALNNLAVAKSEEGQYQDSLSLLERATKLAPDNPDIAANLTRMRAYQTSVALNGTAPADSSLAFRQDSALPEPPQLWQPLAVSRPATIMVNRATGARGGCFSREYAAPNREKTQVKVCDSVR